MEVSLSLSLPREAESVPIVRRICRTALQDLGIREDCISDLEVAVTEACTNVLKHATGTSEYEVNVNLTEETCHIRVVDSGAGFDHRATSARVASPEGESGRGISLMSAVVDVIDFEGEAKDGTIVHLTKKLELDEDSAMSRLSSGSASS